jgi:hypothetical protein
MPDDQNPTLYGTQKDVAWAAWQDAFDAGKLLPDRSKFDDWWEQFGTKVQWKSLQELLHAAWGKGVQDRNEQGTAGWSSWWQAIVDSSLR